MGQAGVDLPDPMGTRPSPGRHGTVAGGSAFPAAGGASLPDDAAADDLLSQLAGEEIDRLLAAADVESEPAAGQPPAPPPVARSPRTPPPTPAVVKNRPVRRTKGQPATARAPKANGSAPQPEPRPKPSTLSPGAHNIIVPAAPEPDPAVQAEFDDAFEQLAGSGGAGIAIPDLEYAENLAPVLPQGGPIDRGPVELHAETIPAALPGEPLGELLEQLTAVRAEVEAEVRAEAEAEARSAGAAGATDAWGEAFSRQPALLPEDDDGPLNLVVPDPAVPLSDESLDAEGDPLDLDQLTTADERAGLEISELDAEPASREVAPVRPPVPVPQDEETFLAEEPPADGSVPAPLPVRVLEWVNKPLAAFPEAVRQAVGKVAILTLINAILVLIYVLLVRR
jgi:hypothetical protein